MQVQDIYTDISVLNEKQYIDAVREGIKAADNGQLIDHAVMAGLFLERQMNAMRFMDRKLRSPRRWL